MNITNRYLDMEYKYLNKKFGFLKVTKILNVDKNYRRFLECKCDCGKTVKVTMSQIAYKNGEISCGCYRRQQNIKHGMSDTPFYSRWECMIKRCDPNYKNKKYYSDKGINCCDEWRNFIRFRDDMHESYLQHIKTNNLSNTTLDRIDNSKGYYKDNCRWATRKQQSDNRDVSIFQKI